MTSKHARETLWQANLRLVPLNVCAVAVQFCMYVLRGGKWWWQ